MSKTQYHVIAASGEYEDYYESLAYVFDNKEQAIAKAKELYKEDEQWEVDAKKKLEEIINKLCKKYVVTVTGEEGIIEGLAELATDEEYEEYDNLWFSLNYPCYDGIRYYVYGYEIGDDGKAKSTDSFFDLKEKDNE